MLKNADKITLLDGISGAYEALLLDKPLVGPLLEFFGLFGIENFTLRQYDKNSWHSITHNMPIQKAHHVDEFVVGDPWAERLEILPSGQFHIDEEILPHQEFITTPYYNELIRPNKINHHALVGIWEVNGKKFRLCLLRPRARRDNSFQNTEKMQWNTLLPSLSRLLMAGKNHPAFSPTPMAPRANSLPLWQSELRILAARASGISLRDYAAKAKITLNTARWYIKSAMRKKGLRSQAELINHLAHHYRDLHWYRRFLDPQ